MSATIRILLTEDTAAHAERAQRALQGAGLDFSLVRMEPEEAGAGQLAELRRANQQLRAELEQSQQGRQDEQTRIARVVHEIAAEKLTAELESQCRQRAAALLVATRVLQYAQVR